MPRIVSVLFLLAVVLVQLAIVQRIEIGEASPDVVLLVIVSIGLLTNSVSGAAHGFVGGLAIGVFAALPLGPHALLGTIVGYAAGRVGEALVTDDHPAPPLVAGVVGTIIFQVGRPLVDFLVAPSASHLRGLQEDVLVVAALSLALAVPVYLLTRRVLELGESLGGPSGTATGRAGSAAPSEASA